MDPPLSSLLALAAGLNYSRQSLVSEMKEVFPSSLRIDR